MTSMTTARKVLSSTLVQVIGKVFIAILGLLTNKMLAVYLSPVERGTYEVVYNVLALAGIVADMGLYTIALREISSQKHSMDKVIGNILSIRNVLCILSFIVTFLAVLLIPSLNQQGPLFICALIIASAGTMFALLNGTVTSVLQSVYEMRHATIAQVLGKVISLVMMAAAMFMFFTKPEPGYNFATDFQAFQWLFMAGLVGNIVMYLYTRYHVKKHTKIAYRFDFEYWKEIVWNAFPYGLALVLSTLYFKIDIFLIQIFIPGDYGLEQVNFYAAPVKIVEIFSVLSQFFLNALLPILTVYILNKDGKLQSLIQRSFEFLLLMAAPVVTVGVALAYSIINATNSEIYLTRLDEGFYGSDAVLQVIIWSVLFSFLNSLFNYMLVALHKQKKLIIINFFSLGFNIIANIILIPYMGIFACAITTVFTEILVLVLSSMYARKYVTFSINFINPLKIIVSSIVAGGVVFFLKDYVVALTGNMIGLLLLGSLSMLLYVALLWLLKVIDKDMLKLLKKA